MPLEHVGTTLDTLSYHRISREQSRGATISRAASDAQYSAKVRARRKREEAAANGDEDTDILSKLSGVNRSVSWGRSYGRPASLGTHHVSMGSPGSSSRTASTYSKNARQPTVDEECVQVKPASTTSSPASSSALSLRSIGAHGRTPSLGSKDIPSPSKAAMLTPLWDDQVDPISQPTLGITTATPLSINKDLPAVPVPEIDIVSHSPIDRPRLFRQESTDGERPTRTLSPSWVMMDGQGSFPRRSISTSAEARPENPSLGASRRHMNAYLARPRRSTPNLAHTLPYGPESMRGSRSLVASPTQAGFIMNTRAQLSSMFSRLFQDNEHQAESPRDSPASSVMSFSRRNSRDSDRSRNNNSNYLQNISQILPRPPPSPMVSAHPSSDEDISDDEDDPVRPNVLSNSVQGTPYSPGSGSLSDYELGSEIGRGAYGFVRRARFRSSSDDYPFIIKYIFKSCILADSWRKHRIYGILPAEIFIMMQAQSLPYDPPTEVPPYIIDREYWLERREKLLAEQRSGSSTGHPSVCGLVDFFEDPEYYYMVMPRFGEGRDLFDEVETSTFGLDTPHVRCYLGQLADALAFLHENGIVHRDVKDENVIIDEHDMVQLIDFGSASHVRAGRMFDTFSGTLDYAAAEILEGKPYEGPAQDIWAFGVVAFVLVCGECPFRDGTEACQGLAENSLPLQLLQRYCLGHDSDSDDDSVSNYDMDLVDSNNLNGKGAAYDLMDLIQQCLLLEPEQRPTVSQVMRHRFIMGPGGWTSASRPTM
ncbi:serine/threonine protein kinase [Malassezia cuniculi]|uniref:Serine/threonine protein kinase n=1 Tax=Malassezia cuniculi TaxID=948313 RepID=A0AAF0ETA6_9BASI|nr:serine/threonine protein kinase [Malassezia cuniculi]